MNPDQRSENRIVDAVRSDPDADPGALVAALERRIRDFAAGVPQSDDITAMVIAYRRANDTEW